MCWDCHEKPVLYGASRCVECQPFFEQASREKTVQRNRRYWAKYGARKGYRPHWFKKP